MTSSLVLPVNGKDYTIPSPPARVGLALQASYTITQARRAGQEPPPYAVERAAKYDDMTTGMDEDCLGPAWEQMIADDVPLADLRQAAAAAYVWIVTGSATAARVIMDPEAAPEAGGSGPKASTTTAAADTTRKRSSTSGTTSRKGKRNS